jgi:phosphoribosyl-dephospho-CoA transferase
MDLKRHALIEISHQGRKKAFEWLKNTISSDVQREIIYQLMVSGYNEKIIPSIVRRQVKTHHTGTLAVGFSSPFQVDGNRLRIPAFVPMDEIVDVKTPYAILARDFFERTTVLKVLAEIRNIADMHHVTMGVWGSASLEIVTGLPYTHKDSDLDLIIRNGDLNKIEMVYSLIKGLGDKFNIKVDMELELKECEIRIAELFTNTESLLGKSIDDVRLYSRKDVLKMISS